LLQSQSFSGNSIIHVCDFTGDDGPIPISPSPLSLSLRVADINSIKVSGSWTPASVINLLIRELHHRSVTRLSRPDTTILIKPDYFSDFKKYYESDAPEPIPTRSSHVALNPFSSNAIDSISTIFFICPVFASSEEISVYSSSFSSSSSATTSSTSSTPFSLSPNHWLLVTADVVRSRMLIFDSWFRNYVTSFANILVAGLFEVLLLTFSLILKRLFHLF
jgi:hypothetical protein